MRYVDPSGHEPGPEDGSEYDNFCEAEALGGGRGFDADRDNNPTTPPGNNSNPDEALNESPYKPIETDKTFVSLYPLDLFNFKGQIHSNWTQNPFDMALLSYVDASVLKLSKKISLSNSGDNLDVSGFHNRVKASGGFKNLTFEAGAVFSAFEGEVVMKKGRFNFTVWGSAGSIGATGKIGAKGIASGGALFLGLGYDLSW